MKRQSQFKYQLARITSERVPSLNLDVRSLIVELVFYENLDKPYLTGVVAISDDSGLFDSVNFSGTERLHIQMLSELSESEEEDIVMDRVFIMSSIINTVKSSNSGQSALYTISLIDEHAVISKSRTVSRSIKDELDKEIIKLCQNECGKNVDLSYANPTVQNNFKGVIPYMNPLEAATWLTTKATTELGMPFYLYASIHDTNLRLGSLDKMLEQPAWNAKSPFIFSPSNTQKQEEGGDPTSQYFQVQSLKTSNVQNTLKQLSTGAIGSQYTVTDLSSGRQVQQHFSIDALLSKADEAGIIDKSKQNVYNDDYKTPDFVEVNIEGQYLHDTNGSVFHQVVSRGVYGDKKSIHDQVSPSMFLKKVEALAYKNAVYKNIFDVTVPGPGFIKSGGTIGDKITINILKDANDPDEPNQLDALRSGDFIVYNTRHQFRDTRHDVAMTVFKLERGVDE
ncbi:hypothetical protein OAS42_00425 [bacterium]|nr:hypothetical protein [bacterium]